MTGGPEAEACACAVACLLIDWSQHPMWPHCAQRRRWSHQPPASRHSTQPVPLGGTSGSMNDGVIGFLLSISEISTPVTQQGIGESIAPQRSAPPRQRRPAWVRPLGSIGNPTFWLFHPSPIFTIWTRGRQSPIHVAQKEVLVASDVFD